MVCYQCGAQVGKAEQCPTCGADLRIFQRVLRISNAYYNDGLQKASVRNLSGAVISLKASLKFNKYHIDARNLLGLVYYETGETVAALSEWVISKSYQPDNNRASVYLDAVQKNQSQLNAINQTIKKYNQALLYCRQDSRDLAIIQLKKVLALNPKLVKGHQLLALLYLQEGKDELAKKTLRSAGKIDTDNTTTLRYLKEANTRLKEHSSGKKKDQSDDLISYQSGNETIIMPKRFKEYSLGATIGSIIIGMLVGVAVTGWLIVPSVKKNSQSAAAQQLLTANETIAANNQTINSLQEQIEDLQNQLDSIEDSSQEVEVAISAYEKFITFCNAYLSGDVVAANEAAGEVDVTQLSSNAKQAYETMNESITEQYIELQYQEGYDYYNSGEYEKAAKALQIVADSDIDYEKGMCAYYLAQAYRRSGDLELAVPYFQYILDNYPGTHRAKTAQNYVN